MDWDWQKIAQIKEDDPLPELEVISSNTNSNNHRPKYSQPQFDYLRNNSESEIHELIRRNQTNIETLANTLPDKGLKLFKMRDALAEELIRRKEVQLRQEDNEKEKPTQSKSSSTSGDFTTNMESVGRGRGSPNPTNLGTQFNEEGTVFMSNSFDGLDVEDTGSDNKFSDSEERDHVPIREENPLPHKEIRPKSSTRGALRPNLERGESTKIEGFGLQPSALGDSGRPFQPLRTEAA
ncbi:hypothetical protein GIB67_007102 [Kingdonia uniflora]|uniref:Uncharacterized protein n=1 Tax=Kingdonia uniflora TaxID=39325 RepID=A0A7J7ML62_9MAGN|nr:hypothetical protein GIB67_007102 [Kingdonia uniflora]